MAYPGECPHKHINHLSMSVKMGASLLETRIPMGNLHDSLILRADMVTNKNWFTAFSSVLLLPFVLDFKSWKAPANTGLCIWTLPFVMTQKLNSQPGLTIQLNGLLTNKNNYMFTYNECENCNCFSYGISVPFCKFCFFLFLFCLFVFPLW